MDALIVDLYHNYEALKEQLRMFGERLDLHCSDGAAHPHEHDLNLGALKEAVDGALSEAADAAIKEHESEEHSSGESGESEGESKAEEETPSPTSEPEKEPERVHVLHRRVG